ncbi:MAG: DUF177 domain-containing protein [Candidatus Saccharicenans sp.]|nr:DUF177 domain-containing protein [Candidatus Saccharicenans sp.]
MVIDVNKIPREGLCLDRDFQFTSLELIEEDAVCLGPTHAVIEIKKAGSEVLIKGKITACLSFICSRCLRAFEYYVNSAFDLVYFPEELDGIKEELAEEDLDKLYYYHQELDLREIVLEQLNLSFPFRPLCSEDCEGICPVCGELVHQGHCSCQVKEPDSRLEKLKLFLRDKR